ncbi:class I SAM-dependent methyltransferase [Consotaella aegiceratis]|uniref:class I SAM-dependent methyltransferase n=1 Tax=Consotaella aegiceratis TaxID=3097961 RepID=UPI002F41B8E6
MNADIIDLREFYLSPLGLAAQRAVQAALTSVWQPITDERLVGLGYTLPYLDRFASDAERAFAFMPAAQGAVKWPAGLCSLTAMVDGEDLPLPDSSVDRILMVHALEFAENPNQLLTEAWRVLAPSGELVVVVPNRRGVWSRFEHTPFGSGRPWSRGQLLNLMRETMFTACSVSEALLFPPFKRRSLLGLAGAMERYGRDAWPIFSGVVVVEAKKQIYRGIPVADARRERQRIRTPVLVPQGLPS